MGKLITLKAYGDFKKTNMYFDKILEPLKIGDLNEYGKMGVKLLSEYTPVDSGKTASSWNYTIETKRGKTTITWSNNNVNDGQNIAILLQYGHATNNGGYVKGRDYINPAIQPLFDKMAKDMWEEVVHA